MNCIFVYPNNIVDASQCLRQATNLGSCKICVSWPKISSSNMENIVYSKYVHQLIKDMGTNMLTLQPSQTFTANSDICDYQHYIGNCCLQL